MHLMGGAGVVLVLPRRSTFRLEHRSFFPPTMKAVFRTVAAALLLAGSIEAQTPLVINTPCVIRACRDADALA